MILDAEIFVTHKKEKRRKFVLVYTEIYEMGDRFLFIWKKRRRNKGEIMEEIVV